MLADTTRTVAKASDMVDVILAKVEVTVVEDMDMEDVDMATHTQIVS